MKQSKLRVSIIKIVLVIFGLQEKCQKSEIFILDGIFVSFGKSFV
jgi:hypothetical protein